MSSHNILANFNATPLLSTKKDAKFFVDRENELFFVKFAIENYMNVLLAGERGSGKTSLLNHIEYLFQTSWKNENIILVQITRLFDVDTPKDFLNILTYELTKRCIKHPLFKKTRMMNFLKKIMNSSPIVGSTFETRAGFGSEDIGTQNRSNNYSSLITFEELLTKLSQKNLKACFLIDNSDKCSEKIYNIFSSLRDSLWITSAHFIVVADYASISIYKKPPLDAFFDRVIPLKPFRITDIEKLVKIRLTKNPTNKALKLLQEVTNRQPREIISTVQIILTRYMLKKIDLNQESNKYNKISEDDIEDFLLNFENLLNEYIQEKNSQFKLCSTELSEIKNAVLNYLSQKGASSASDNEFQKEFQVSRTRLVQILKDLEFSGLIKSKRFGRKKLYFPLDGTEKIFRGSNF